MTSTRSAIDVSVILPAYNEAAVLPRSHQRISSILAGIGCSYEIIVVDDGSTDSTSDVLIELQQRDPRLRIVELSRNFGHQAALGAGLDHATGRAVISMDADLQHPPEVIRSLLDYWREGYDVVYTVRGGDGADLKATTSFVFYRLFQLVTGLDLRPGAADFRLIDRRVMLAIRGARERYLFLRGFVSWIGFRQKAVPYEVEERPAGDSKYSWTRMLRFAVDGFLSYSSLPLRMATCAGLLSALAGGAFGIFALYSALVVGNVVPGWTSLIVVVLVLGGVQLVLLGLIGEYISRIYQDVKGRPAYLVRETRGFGDGAPAFPAGDETPQ